jgi:hypothetical protein
MELLTRRFRMVFLLLCSIAPAQAGGSLSLHEQEIKAGLLYNFLKYTTWPESSFTPAGIVTVCIYGDDPFGGGLKPMEGRTVNQRAIAVRQLRDMDGCHLLFVNAREKDRWPQLKQALAQKNILTVSDFSAFASSGGMIELGHRDNRVNASLNIDAVNAAGLRVEDRMLKLVTVTHQGERP